MRKKQIIGLVLMLASVAALVLWETVLRQDIVLTQVLVCTRDITKGEIIKEGCFRLVSTTPESVVPGALKGADARAAMESETFAGLVAAEYLRKNTQVIPEYFSGQEYSSEEKYCVVVEKDWLSSLGSGLLKDDLVDLYLAGSGEFLGSFRLACDPAKGQGLEIKASIPEYLAIRAAALSNGAGSIIAAGRK